MVWVKLDDAFYDNATNRRLGTQGRDLFIAGLAFCAKGLTDGRIDKHDLDLVLAMAQAKRATAGKLVAAGRWVDRGDHFEVAGYLDYQLSKEQVLRARDAARRRQDKARDNARKSRRDNDRDSQRTDAVSNGPPVPSRPRTTPLPPASGGHDGQHSNCRACGTNQRGPQPPPRPLLPPTSAPETIADFEPPPARRIPETVAANNLAEIATLRARRAGLHADRPGLPSSNGSGA